MVMEGGYPREVFVESVREEVVCGLCENVIRTAKMTPCGHVYCKSCLERWVSQHGVCPERCRELAVKGLTGAGHIDTVVSGLTARCINAGSGCKVQLPLGEKAAHECKCPYGGPSDGPECAGIEWAEEEEEEEEEKESLGFFQRATKIVLSFRSRNARKKSSAAKSEHHQTVSPLASKFGSFFMIFCRLQTSGSMLTQRTYRLKRNRPKEPLGLVLLSGDKVKKSASSAALCVTFCCVRRQATVGTRVTT